MSERAYVFCCPKCGGSTFGTNMTARTRHCHGEGCDYFGSIDNDHLHFKSPFNEELLAAVKAMSAVSQTDREAAQKDDDQRAARLHLYEEREEQRLAHMRRADARDEERLELAKRQVQAAERQAEALETIARLMRGSDG